MNLPLLHKIRNWLTTPIFVGRPGPEISTATPSQVAQEAEHYLALLRRMEMKAIRSSELLGRAEHDKPQWQAWDTAKAISDGFKADHWVYICVSRLAEMASSVPWVAKFKKDGNRAEGHPLELLMEDPNPKLSRQDLIEIGVGHLLLGGNFLWSKIRVRRLPVELWPLDVPYFKPIPHRIEFISGYEYRRGEIKHVEPAEDVVHGWLMDPGNLYWGMSPLQAASKLVDIRVEAHSWQLSSFKNRAVSDGVFTFDHPINEAQWQEARAQIREQQAGAKNARMPWVLGYGAKWHQMSLTPLEMDYLASQRFSREDICAIFRMPPPMVGLLEYANYANMGAAERICWTTAVIPILANFAGALNRSLAPEFGDDVILDYDLSGVEALQVDLAEKAPVAQAFWAMGVPFAEVNRRMELGFDEDAIPNAHEPWGGRSAVTPFTAQPEEGGEEEGGQADEGDEEFDDDRDDVDEELGPGETRARKKKPFPRCCQNPRSGASGRPSMTDAYGTRIVSPFG